MVTCGAPSMRLDEFQQRAKEWVSTYKGDVLGVKEHGIWVRNREAHPHILPKKEQRLNILPCFRDEVWVWFPGQRISLHRDFHHPILRGRSVSTCSVR